MSPTDVPLLARSCRHGGGGYCTGPAECVGGYCREHSAVRRWALALAADGLDTPAPSVYLAAA